MLQALADSGVLIAIASKNEREVVDQALQRSDLRISAGGDLSLGGALGAEVDLRRAHSPELWNISADAVVFVDDSPLDIAEVSAAHPGIECLQFPQRDNAAGVRLLERLRDLFAKGEVSYEDSIRLESIRSTAAPRAPRVPRRRTRRAC